MTDEERQGGSEIDPEVEVAEGGEPRRLDPVAERRASHLGFVAHEIRNPLSTALWTAELLGRMDAAERAGARGEKLAGMCLRSLQRVRILVEDHLLAERLDAGGYPIRPEPLALVDALVAAEGRRGGAGAPLELRVDPSIAVLADRPLLSRLLDALLDAAGQGGGSVLATAAAAGGEVRLELHGVPADPAALEDPLRGAPSDTRGRALALPTARRIALRIGARLEPGDGAWRLVLPEALDRADEG